MKEFLMPFLARQSSPLNAALKLSHSKHTYIFSFFFLPIIVSVAWPTGPHPPLRLARRPNRGHIGGGGWTLLRYMPMMFLSRVGSALPPSSTVKSMHQGIFY